MALASQAALLDELMGRQRNTAPNKKGRNEPEWTSEDVCKPYLVAFCPHDLFINTRADIGACEKIHDDRLAEEYKKGRHFERMGYEEEFYRYMRQCVADVERRIKRGHERLNLNSTMANPNGLGNQEKKTAPANPTGRMQEKLELLSKKITELIEQAEELGTQGKVEDSQGVLKLVEQLRSERAQLQNEGTDSSLPQAKELEVCEVCGAFRIKDDAPQRIEEHLLGKMHVGYARIRNWVRTYEERKKASEEEIRMKRFGRSSHRSRRRSSASPEADSKEAGGSSAHRHRDRGRSRSRSGSHSRRRPSHKSSRHRSRSRSYGGGGPVGGSNNRRQRRSRSRSPSRHRHHRPGRHHHRSNRREDRSSRSRSRDRHGGK